MPRLIRSQPLIPTQESASGVWSLDDAFNAVKTKTWPIAGQVVRSLRFNDDESSYLSRTPASAGNRKTFTFSTWVKRTNFGFEPFFRANKGSTTTYSTLNFNSSGELRFFNLSASTNIGNVQTSMKFRDPSAWYHIVVAVDTTEATGTDRVKMYVNGVQQALTFNTTPALNAEFRFNVVNEHLLGTLSGTSNFDGYLAEVNFIDGTALDADSFGELRNGVWSPIDTAGLTFGTNGFYLKFNDSTDLGKDVSGNGNDFAANNLFANDVVIDSVKDNFCTWDPLIGANFNVSSQMGSSIVNFANGNLDLSNDANSGFAPRMQAFSTLGMRSGKWYSEHTNLSNIRIGIAKGPYVTSSGSAVNNSVTSDLITANGASGSVLGTAATFTSSDVLGIAFDADNNLITFYKNGVQYGQISNITSDVSDQDWLWARSPGSSGSGSSNNSNFGQRPFAYTPPTGYLPLSTDALPATVTPGDYFNTVSYTGTDAEQSVTGVGFQPDLVILKDRSRAERWSIADSVRGANKILTSIDDRAEESRSDLITSFDADGFGVGGAGPAGFDGDQFIAYAWKAGGTPVSNTDGSIASQVSANTDAGFSIVSYTGTGSDGSVGHGLSQTPEFFILKNRDDTSDWYTYTTIVDGSMDYFFLNTTATKGDSGLTAPTSSLIYVGGSQAGNSTSGEDQIIYAFHSVEGFSKFGSYQGNGNADGPFVYTGFRPAFVMIKPVDNAGDWIVVDTFRDAQNPAQKLVYLNLNTEEQDGVDDRDPDVLIDINSNGFKVRSTNNDLSVASENFVYMAFAETPLKTTRAR